MSQVAAVSGATGDEFDALRNKAREMGAKTKFSASEAADAFNEKCRFISLIPFVYPW